MLVLILGCWASVEYALYWMPLQFAYAPLNAFVAKNNPEKSWKLSKVLQTFTHILEFRPLTLHVYHYEGEWKNKLIPCYITALPTESACKHFFSSSPWTCQLISPSEKPAEGDQRLDAWRQTVGPDLHFALSCATLTDLHADYTQNAAVTITPSCSVLEIKIGY